MVTFGYNLDTSSIPLEKALQSLKASGANAHTIVIDPHSFWLGTGDLDTIRKYANALPNATLIIRTYHALEGNWSLYPKAIEYETHWRWVKNQLGESVMQRIVFDDPVNEPNLAGDNPVEARAYVNRCLALVKAADNAGVKLAIGAWSIGTPHENLFETEYLPLWRACKRYSLHLYGGIPSEMGELAPYNIILDAKKARTHIKDERWPISHQGWLIARSYRIIQLFEKHGLGIPELYVTEGIIDQISDMGQYIKDAWKAKYGIPAFQNDPRGAQSWERYLQSMFEAEGFDFQKALAFLHRHARKNIFYHPAFKAVCIFALNVQWGYKYAGYANDGQHREAGSNYDHPAFDTFRNVYLPAINAESFDEIPVPPPVVTPPKEPIMLEKRIRSNAIDTQNGTRIRKAPITGETIGYIPHIAWQDCLVADDYEAATWVKVEVGALVGYVSRQYVNIENRVIEAPPEPSFMVDFTITMTDDVRGAFQTIATALANAKQV